MLCICRYPPPVLADDGAPASSLYILTSCHSSRSHFAPSGMVTMACLPGTTRTWARHNVCDSRELYTATATADASAASERCLKALGIKIQISGGRVNKSIAEERLTAFVIGNYI